MNWEAWADYLAGYLNAWNHAAILSDWNAPVVQFLSTLLAGLISFSVAYWTVSRQERLSTEKKSTEERKAAMNAVTLAFYKLIDCGEILAGMRKHLDEQFKMAATDGFASEPYQAIRPTKGKDYTPERVDLNEISFLVKTEDTPLIAEISLVYRRTINCIQLSEEHSNERIALQEWIHSLPGHEGDLDGDIAQDAFPIQYRAHFDRRAANLNLIISAWVDQIEETLALTRQVIERLGKASKAEFGANFPIFAVEFPTIPIYLDDIRDACRAAKTRFTIENGRARPATEEV